MENLTKGKANKMLAIIAEVLTIVAALLSITISMIDLIKMAKEHQKSNRPSQR